MTDETRDSRHAVNSPLRSTPRERNRGGHSRTSEEPTMSTVTTEDGTEISYNAEMLAFLHS